MDEGFAVRLKQLILELDQAVLTQIRNDKRKWISEEYAQQFGRFRGCSLEEIAILKHDQKVDYLPELYTDIMQLMGKQAGNIVFRSSDYTCGSLKEVKEYAAHMVEIESETLRLPSDAFVFFMHQGYHFDFFRTEERLADPPVYAYREGMENFTKAADSLSEWYLDQVIPIRNRVIGK